jgi:PIN domain nuclease of toxin-antitoxin system
MPTVLDSSAVIAALIREPGAEKVRESLADAMISSVNYSEVVAYFALHGHGRSAISALLDPLDLEILPFNAEYAMIAGLLAADTRDAGLSLGDRACLSVALGLGANVLTGDRIWSKVGVKLGIEIELIR